MDGLTFEVHGSGWGCEPATGIDYSKVMFRDLMATPYVMELKCEVRQPLIGHVPIHGRTHQVYDTEKILHVRVQETAALADLIDLLRFKVDCWYKGPMSVEICQ